MDGRYLRLILKLVVGGLLGGIAGIVLLILLPGDNVILAVLFGSGGTLIGSLLAASSEFM